MRMFVIGNKDSVLGFSLAGVAGRSVTSQEQLKQAIDSALADRTIGLLIFTKDVADWERERIDQLKIASQLPLVVEVPGRDGEGASTSLQEFVQSAIGIRLGGGM